MNDNPVGTPNPLNPTPGEAPVAETPVTPVEPAAPAGSAPQPIASEQPAVAETAAPVAAPAKKKKGGLIAGIICGVVALGCAIAAILVIFVFNKPGDPVSDALIKLINGENKNIAGSGVVDINAGTIKTSANIAFSFDSTAQAGTLSVLTSSDGTSDAPSLEIEARATGDGEAFVKIDGIKNAMFSAMGIDCTASASLCDQYIQMLNTSSYSDDSAALLTIDGEWVKLNTNAANIVSLPGGMSMDSINASKDKLVEAYKKYPFIISSTDNLGVAKKDNPIYKLGIDYDKAAGFYNEFLSASVSASDLKNTLTLPGDIYVEIDNNHNLSRLVVSGIDSVGLDISLTYPTNINVEKPTDYTTSTAIDDLLKNFTKGSSINIDGGSSSIIDYDNGGYDYNDDGSWTYPLDDDDDEEEYDWSWTYED